MGRRATGKKKRPLETNIRRLVSIVIDGYRLLLMTFDGDSVSVEYHVNIT